MRCAADDVPCVVADGEIVPDWLGTADQPWLRELLLLSSAFDGKPFVSLREAWRRGEVPPRAGERWRAVLSMLRRFVLPRRREQMSTLRARVFAAVAAGASREQALASAGTPAQRDLLFADVGEQRPVCWPEGLDPDVLRRAVNGLFARQLLATANAAELTLHGASRAVLRTAWLHGVFFAWVSGDRGAAVLRWLPPPGAARAGRRLAATLPVLAWTRRFVLRAACGWRGVRGDLVLSSLDALPVGVAPAVFDSAWERQLAAALVRLLPGWEVLREPAPLPIGDRLAFPDFASWPAGDGEKRWWIELAGLRDRNALSDKVGLLMREPRYVLCLPERTCPRELIGHPRVIGFAGRNVCGAAERVAAVLRRGRGVSSG